MYVIYKNILEHCDDIGILDGIQPLCIMLRKDDHFEYRAGTVLYAVKGDVQFCFFYKIFFP